MALRRSTRLLLVLLVLALVSGAVVFVLGGGAQLPQVQALRDRLGLAGARGAGPVDRDGAAGPVDATSRLIARGEYLARAADCIACHTPPGGPEYAGGHAMPTPFGALYTPNITPDEEHGIGAWTADDFFRMMRQGVGRDGKLLYPAMPFPSYTKVTREDSDAMYAFFMSLEPVARPNRPHDLRFPYNNRELLVGWRALFFREGEFRPDAAQTPEWNRGAYLVEGLGHCAMCHSAVNALGGTSEKRAFQGGLIPNQNWYAPSLTSNREAGLGEWSLQDIEDVLQTGLSRRGAVVGPMAEVVYHSLQHLTDADIRAMAVYLKALPQADPTPPPDNQARLVAPETMERGRRLYDRWCAVCHGDEGQGVGAEVRPLPFPPLAGNQSVSVVDPINAIRVVLHGGYPAGTRRNPRPHGMPPYGHVLDDDDIAALVTYIRVAWDNRGTPVTANQVNAARRLPLQ